MATPPDPTPAPSVPVDRRRGPVWALFLAGLVGWVLVTWTCQIVQGIQLGHGTGPWDSGYVSPKVVAAVDHGAGPWSGVWNGSLSEAERQAIAAAGYTNRAIVAHTSKPGSAGGFVGDTWRILASLAAMIGLIFFWYFVISRLSL